MKIFAYGFAAICATMSLSACTSTSETPIAPNVVRLDTQASGLLFTGKVGQDTLVKAAQTTIAHGYQYFQFADVSTGQGSQFAGVVTSGSASVYGGYGFARGFGTAVSTPIYRPTATESVTVIMSNDPLPQGWNAAEVLAQSSKH